MADAVKRRPAAPARPHVTKLTPGSVTLAWPASRGAARYQVVRNGRRIATVRRRSYTDHGVKAGHVYTYALRAVDAHGKVSRPSPARRVRLPLPPDRKAPSAPGGLRAAAVTAKAVWLA